MPRVYGVHADNLYCEFHHSKQLDLSYEEQNKSMTDNSSLRNCITSDHIFIMTLLTRNKLNKYGKYVIHGSKIHVKSG